MRAGLRVVAVNAGLLLAGLVVGEVIFGSWLFGPKWGMLNIPRNEDRVFDVQNLYGDPEKAVYRRDHYGLRGQYDDLGKIDILTLGGSTTDQRFVGEGKTWQDMLAERFANAGVPQTVVNAGIDGQSTIGHRKALEVWFPNLPGLHARAILAYIGVNDAHVKGAGVADTMLAPNLVRRLRNFADNNSAVVRLYRTLAGAIRARKVHVVHGDGPIPTDTVWQEPASPPDIAAFERDNAADLEAYEQRVHALIKDIRAFGAQAIIVTQSRADYRMKNGRVLGRRLPDGRVETGSYAMQAANNARAMRACRDEAAICLDLGQELTFANDAFYDWGHTTPAGNGQVADYLFEKLSNGVLEAVRQ